MKVRMLFLFLLLWTVFPTSGASAACDQITTWDEADASVFPLTMESGDVDATNEPQIWLGGAHPATRLHVSGLKSWKVEAEVCKWRIHVEILSYTTEKNAEEENKGFEVPPGRVVYMEDPLSYYEGFPEGESYPTRSFGLRDVYLNNIIYITGFQSVPPVGYKMTPEALDPFFMELFQIAKALINTKCGIAAGNPPTVKLTPYSEGYVYAFEWSILQGKGFRYTITDEDGIKGPGGKWYIDWKTFKVFRDGEDITAHFITTSFPLVRGAGVNDENTELVVLTLPHPKEFMKDDNVFDIRENGWHEIQFRVCDTDGLCGSSPKYRIYFGPIVWMKYDGVEKGGVGQNVLRYHYAEGNLGRRTEARLFKGIYNHMWMWRYFDEGDYLWGEEFRAWESFADFPSGHYFATKKEREGLPLRSEVDNEKFYEEKEDIFGYVIAFQDKLTGGLAFDWFFFPTADLKYPVW